MTQDLLLSNTSIVVTRPSHQSGPFCDKLRELGAEPIAFPCIEIEEHSDPISFSPNEIDLVIFVSPNAVEYGYRALPDLPMMAQSCQFFAVGPATTESLHLHGVEHVLSPTTTPDSEGLLAIEELKELQGKSVLVIKGVGGRPYLKDCLIQRGANLYSIDVYKRALPKEVVSGHLEARIDLILFTSSEIVENFLAITPKELQESLLHCQTIVGHPRIAEKVSSLGFEKLPIIATSPADRDMLATIKIWAQKNGE